VAVIDDDDDDIIRGLSFFSNITLHLYIYTFYLFLVKKNLSHKILFLKKLLKIKFFNEHFFNSHFLDSKRQIEKSRHHHNAPLKSPWAFTRSPTGPDGQRTLLREPMGGP